MADDKKKDDLFQIVGVFLLIAVMIVGLGWLWASQRIVLFWSPKLYAAAQGWRVLWPFSSDALLLSLHEMGARFMRDPGKVGLFEWLKFVHWAIWPANIFVVGLISLPIMKSALRRRKRLVRRFSPQMLAEYLSHIFTGTAPILHIRKQIAFNKDPLWRRQTFPHEVLLFEKVDGRPLVVQGELVPERVREYFRGIVYDRSSGGDLRARLVGGRMISRTLGRQVVDLPRDRGKSIVFPDRFSPVGKVLFALLCAKAFGGKEGAQDYEKARDQLNNSARGVTHGFANLTVAQWLYDKYRTNKQAHNLFAILHWEYTYLFRLLISAKITGKSGHWEWIWLKPMDRALFYVLNTVGRFTPHTESAAAFAQFAYEMRCAKLSRFPLANVDGVLRHVIYVEKAAKALELEWERWCDGAGVDDGEEWWTKEDLWKRLGTGWGSELLQGPLPPPPGLEKETPFDSAMTQAAAERAEKERAESRRRGAEMTDELGGLLDF